MVSIIILAYKNNSLTRECVDSIGRYTPEDYELIIIDNASQLTLPGARCREIRLVKNKKNTGFARGANQGAALARGEYLLFLNNDTLVTRGWLGSMLEIIEGEERVGIVGCLLLFPGDGRIQHAGVVFSNRLPGHIYYQEDPSLVPINQVREFPAVTGACLLIKKRLFQAVGGFDISFLNSYEDVDLCLKVRKRGYRVLYTPRALVYHYGSLSPDRHKFDRKNLKHLLDKWQGSELLE